MTNSQAKSELMQIYMSLSEEKKKALDMAFKAMEQADGEYISRQAVIDIIEDVCPIYGNDYRYILREKVNELPSVAIPSAEPYKGMTNREVIMALFPNPDKIDGYFSFTEEWANAPYTRKER